MNRQRIRIQLNRIIIVVIVSSFLVGCSGSPPPSEPEYELQIIPPPSANGYPFEETVHSYPIVLQFNFNYNAPANQAIPADSFIPLYRIEYHIQANPDEWPSEEPTPTPFALPHISIQSGTNTPQSTQIPQATADGTNLVEATASTPDLFEPPPLITEEPPNIPCPSTLYGDSLDLFGNKGPGRIEVLPSVVIPPGVTKLRVCAWLYFLDGNGEVQTRFDRVEFSVNEPLDGSSRYLRYRDEYLRLHLISAGRGLSWTWLKQYEPSVDRKDLLYNSQAVVVSKMGEDDYFSNLYVPWVANIPSVGSGIILGGDENPLLRGGIAMATFGLEYLMTSNEESLRAALDLFKYVEASEWIDQSEQPTGFFLRSRWPGYKEEDGSSGLPLYASTDEMAGMILGLYYLHEALEKAGWTTESQKVVDLVKRLGDHLRKNSFFIVPPDDPRLPQERQKGWAGMYPFQWFFNGGLKAITGESFKPSEDITLLSPEWERISMLPRGSNLDNDDELGLTMALLALGLSSKERAILSIQGIGIHMRYGGDSIPIRINISNPLEPVPIPVDIPIKVDEEFPQFNFPMLLHVFQLGLADEELRDEDTVKAVKLEMSNLIAGVLGTEPIKVVVPLGQLGSQLLGLTINIAEGVANYLVINPLLPGFNVEVADFQTLEVGLQDSNDDFYAAAIADYYDLFDDDPEYAQILGFVIERNKNAFSNSLPIGKPDKVEIMGEEDVCPDVIKDLNPDNKIGTAFLWEFRSSYIQGGGIKHGAITKTMVADLWRNCKDVIKQGAGLGYMFPSMLIAKHYADQSGYLDQEIVNGINVPEPFGFRFPLPVCSSFPFDATEGVFDLSPCESLWPGRPTDRYEENDLIEQAYNLHCGVVTDLTIDRSTLYSKGDDSTPFLQDIGRDRKKPVSGTFFGSSSSGDAEDTIAKIWSTDDIDYFYVNCDPITNLRVEAIVEADEYSFHKMVVDGIQANSLTSENGYHHIEIEVAPKNVHYIMFTGDAADYELSINPVP